MKSIPQQPFLHGLQAANSVLAQPKGSVTRISNFCYKKRGAMSTVDGTEIINWYNGAIQTSRGMVESISLFQPINVARYFMILADALDQHLGAPTGLAASLAAGGSLSSGTTYYYKVTAIDGVGGETTVSNEVNATPSGGNLSVALTWTAVTNAYAYNVYRGTSSGSEILLAGTGLPTTTNSFTDTGFAPSGSVNLLASPNGAFYGHHAPNTNWNFSVASGLPVTGPGITFYIASVTNPVFDGTYVSTSVSGNTVFAKTVGGPAGFGASGGGTISLTSGGGGVGPPSSDTTQQMALFKMPNVGNYPISYSNSNIVALFPASPTPIQGGEPAGSGGGGGTSGGGIVGGTAPTANGGIIGDTGPVPQFAQFNNQLIIALGNGFSPQIFTDPNTVTAITNSFVPAFDAWLQGSPYAINSIVVPASTPWAPEVAYVAQSAVVADVDTGFYYVAIKGGTSGASEPAFPTTIGLTVVDSGVTWLCAGSSLFYYKAIQGGVSGGTASTFTVPAFPQTPGGTVKDGSVIWQNAGLLTSAAPPPPGAAHAIVYSGSLWVANTWPVDNANGIDGPCSLRMSDTNAPTSWNPINQAFLDKDDGTEIQGMASFTISAQGIPPEGSMVVFKDFATYQILGIFGASNFAIQRVVTDMGCVAPRSIQFVPGFGIMRLTHLGIAVFDGVRDKVISEEIRPYLFPSNDNNLSDIVPMDQNYSYSSYGFQTANPPMYCLAVPVGTSGGKLTRIFCYDLVTKEWGIVDLPFAVSAATQVRAEGTIPIAMFGGFLDGVLQRWQAGDIQWYTGAAVPNLQNVGWSFRTQESASQVADQRLYYRRAAIRGYNTNSTSPVKVIPVVNGIPGNVYTSPPLPLGDFEIFAPIAQTGVRAHMDISGFGDVEIMGISFHVEPKPVGASVVIS